MIIVDLRLLLKSAQLALLSVMLLMATFASGQVTVVPAAQSGPAYTLNDIAAASYFNTSSQRYSGCYAEISGDNLSTGQSFMFRTASFDINAGVNIPGYATMIGAMLIKPSEDYFSLERMGKLPAGKYNLCVVLHSNRGVELGKACINVNIEVIGSAVLISPVDEQVMHTFAPSFAWQTINLINDNTYTYNIHIAELYEGQSYVDAISFNPPLVYEKGLMSGAYMYPGSAPALEEEKKYVWQVEIVSNAGKSIYSEIWMFQYKKTKTNTPDKRPKGNTQQYPHLTKVGTSAVYRYADKIYFMYDNYANDSLLDYSIIRTGAVNPITTKLKASIILKPYHNYLSMSIPDELKKGKENDKKLYVLQVRNSRKENWTLKFIIKNDKENK